MPTQAWTWHPGVWAAALVLAAAWCRPGMGVTPGREPRAPWTVELDTTSEFSHIRVSAKALCAAWYSCATTGRKPKRAWSTSTSLMSFASPMRGFMFASYLLRPKQEKALIVGLGGGAMVHFLGHYDPHLAVDAVEIDSEVVKIAADYFACRSGGKVSIITADGLKYLETTAARYDAIYMDVFLKPAADTDATGVPLRMKTLQFYQTIQSKLAPGGVVAFNLNVHQRVEADIAALCPPLGRFTCFALRATTWSCSARRPMPGKRPRPWRPPPARWTPVSRRIFRFKRCSGIWLLSRVRACTHQFSGELV